MSEVVPFREAKAHLSEFVERAARKYERFLLMKKSGPAAVLISSDDLSSLEETIEILSDRQLLASIHRSRLEAAEGRHLPLRRPTVTPDR